MFQSRKARVQYEALSLFCKHADVDKSFINYVLPVNGKACAMPYFGALYF